MKAYSINKPISYALLHGPVVELYLFGVHNLFSVPNVGWDNRIKEVHLCTITTFYRSTFIVSLYAYHYSHRKYFNWTCFLREVCNTHQGKYYKSRAIKCVGSAYLKLSFRCVYYSCSILLMFFMSLWEKLDELNLSMFRGITLTHTYLIQYFIKPQAMTKYIRPHGYRSVMI